MGLSRRQFTKEFKLAANHDQMIKLASSVVSTLIQALKKWAFRNTDLGNYPEFETGVRRVA